METGNTSLPTPNQTPTTPEVSTQTRLERLTEVFLDISKPPEEGLHNPHSLSYIQHGNGLQRCLDEILEIRGPSLEDQHIADLRQAYMETLFVKAGLITPQQRRLFDARSDELHNDYT